MGGRGRGRGRARGRRKPDDEEEVRPPGQDEVVQQMAGLTMLDQRQEAGKMGRGRGRGEEGKVEVGGVEERVRGGGHVGGGGADRGRGKFSRGIGEEGGGARGGDRGGGGRGRGRGRGGRGRGRGLQAMSDTKDEVVWTKPQHVSNKSGTSGTPILLRANYYRLTRATDWVLCSYHVDFSPPEERTGVKKQLLRQHTQALGNYIFDGSQLFLSHKLSQDPLKLVSKRPDTNQPYEVTIRFVKEIPPSDTQFIQIFSILLRRCFEHLGLTQLGRYYYDSREEVQNHKYRVSIWPGFMSSIRQHEHHLMMMVDINHKFLRHDTLLVILANLKRSHPDNYKWVASKEVLGMVVMTVYNQRTYRVDDIAWNLSATSKFELGGKEITYIDYYQQTYQVNIRDPHQPLLLSKPKRRDLRRGSGDIYLVPELCVATGLSNDMRNDYHVMRDMAAWTRMPPDKRVLALKKFNAQLFANEKVKAELQQWGLEFSQQMSELRGRVLPREPITQGDLTFTYAGQEPDWCKQVKGASVNATVALRRWVLVFPARQRAAAEDLLAGLRRVCRTMGMTIAPPAMESLQGDLAGDYVHALGGHSGTQMVVCVLPNSRLDRYAAIKRHLCMVMAVPSQMVLARTLQNKPRQLTIIDKIAHQMNAKLGGENWNVQIPFQNTMVVGYDAFHDRTRRGDSWGAVVASSNRNLTRYYGQVNRHANQEELTTNFCSAIQNALGHYVEVNGRLPDRVIVYRDGVGEGQLTYVRDTEIAAIKACFSAHNYSPSFSFVVVSKRINTRLFAQGATSGNPINPPPGTVCDDVVTLPERYDFFLVSQRVSEGTVSPTSYNILDDVNSNLDPDRHQRLAYKLSFLYFNWKGPVRVPAPCLYAHKLAFITGQALHDAPHPKLRDKLWFL